MVNEPAPIALSSTTAGGPNVSVSSNAESSLIVNVVTPALLPPVSVSVMRRMLGPVGPLLAPVGVCSVTLRSLVELELTNVEPVNAVVFSVCPVIAAGDEGSDPAFR